MEAVIFVGIQGAGKSTFYQERFFATHLRLNLDMLRTRHREALLLDACIRAKQRFVVDNTNATAAHRARYVEPARAAGFRVIGYFFDVAPREALGRNAQRQGKQRVPERAIYGTQRQLEPPSLDEGFDELFRVTHDEAGRFQVEPLE